MQVPTYTPAVARFTRSELEAFRGATVDDVVADPMRLLFVGINPGLWTAAVNTHFARPGNRFWPAMYLAGVTAEEVDAGDGLSAAQREQLWSSGIGITNIVEVATARADELSREQYVAGGKRLRQFVRRHQPGVVAVLGVSAFRVAYGAPKVAVGPQDEPFEGAALWVLPNPSGLNAHESVWSLAAWYRRAAEAAGVRLHRPLDPHWEGTKDPLGQ